MDYGDSIDRNLVSILEENARLPASELARRVGLARSSVQERIGRLERRGVILGYRAIVRRTKDDNSISAYLFITASQRIVQRLLRRYALIRKFLQQMPSAVRRTYCVGFMSDFSKIWRH
jgi:DNA-binding Lrp family transcriptional regulator